jgi:hypothetical protein
MLTAGVALAQEPSPVPDMSEIYCSGLVTTDAVPRDTYLISGEESNVQLTFAQGNLVYINRGSSQGVKVGDEFSIIRAVTDPLKFKWFVWQPALLRAMGTTWADLGRVRVVNVQPKVSTAEVAFSCEYMQRGDIAVPFVERPAPRFREASTFDRFAPVSGKPLAMVVTTKNFGQLAGSRSTVYANLGSTQGVKVGDYFRIFRHQGTRTETAYQNWGMAYKAYGFGSTPVSYKWDDLPREIVGEGIVLRVGPNSSTILITITRREIYVGDYVEIE